MVFLSVFEIQGELVLAPADLKPTWCWEFSGQVWPVTVLQNLGQLGASCG